MTETELRKHRCCFSGHRPEKLKITEKELARLLEVEIKRAVASGFTTYITGMARGTDLVAAEIVLRLRERDDRLKLICALPHPGFGQHWGGGWSERSQRVLARVDLTRTICPSFSYAAYQARKSVRNDHEKSNIHEQRMGFYWTRRFFNPNRRAPHLE